MFTCEGAQKEPGTSQLQPAGERAENSYKHPHEHWAFSKRHFITTSVGRCVYPSQNPQLGTLVSELDFITEEALSSFKITAFFFFFHGNNPNTYR